MSVLDMAYHARRQTAPCATPVPDMAWQAPRRQIAEVACGQVLHRPSTPRQPGRTILYLSTGHLVGSTHDTLSQYRTSHSTRVGRQQPYDIAVPDIA
eukprot:1747421-Rhodomonas_salina.1